MEQQSSIAIFIDAENINGKCAQYVFETAQAQGNILFKRIYADWRKENLVNWEDSISNYSIKAMQCFAFASGKNSSDMLMVTDILEILYEKKIDIFVIVSSDSDFTNVVQKLRESGKKVLGFGATPNSAISYINSFNEFFYIDDYCTSKPANAEKTGIYDRLSASDDATSWVPPRYISNSTLKNIDALVERIIDECGRAEYDLLRDEIMKISPDFLPRNYGYDSFRSLIKGAFLPCLNGKYRETMMPNGVSYCLIKDIRPISAATIKVIDNVIEQIIDLRGTAEYSMIFSEIVKVRPTFSYKNYNYPNFRTFLTDGFLPHADGKYENVMPAGGGSCFLRRVGKDAQGNV